MRKPKHKPSSFNLAEAGLQMISPFASPLPLPSPPVPQQKQRPIYRITLQSESDVDCLQLKLAQWPDPKHLQLNSYRASKNFHLLQILPSTKSFPCDHLNPIEIARFTTHKNSGSKSTLAWIFFDLVQTNTHLIAHFQIHIHLDLNSNVHQAILTRLELNSNRLNPNPSNSTIGSFRLLAQNHLDQNNTTTTIHLSFTKEQIHQEFENLLIAQNSMTCSYTNLPRNKPTHTIKSNLVPTTKSLSIFSFVSHPKIIASFGAGPNARYHQRQLPQYQLGHHQNLKTIDCFIVRSDHLLSVDLNDSNRAWFFIQHLDSFGYILHRSVIINPISGLVTEGDKLYPLASTSETQSILLPNLNLSISYGFHDSPRMGKRHCMYTYVTPDHSSWLQNLINENPKWLDEQFSRLVLQGSHDSGMFTNLHPGFVKLITKMKLDGDLGNFLIDHGIPFVHVLTKLLKVFNIDLERAICNIANTQKDVIFDQLRLGARFFDFRPGYCVHDCLNGERGAIYHQHACVPGYAYVKALEEVFTFLASHPCEIVVFELKSDGFISQKTTWRKDSIPFLSMIPTKAALGLAVEEARTNLKISSSKNKNILDMIDGIKVGGPSDLDRKIGDLLEDGVRLIIIHRMGHVPEAGWDWERDDSYDHVLYDTDRPQEIIQALDVTHSRNSIPTKSNDEKQNLKPLRGTIYQLQATPTKSVSDDINSSLTYSKASSLLVYTKANLDPFTYKWVKDRHFIEPGLVVLLNDFVDSVLTEHAMEKSKIRAGFFSSV